MKKVLLMTAVLLLLCVPALAETQVFCTGEAGDAVYDAAAVLAEKMEGEVVSAPTALDAVNLFLAADGNSAVYVGDPSVMILSLQGYTDQDLRTAVTPAAMLAGSPATLYATEAVLNACEDMTEDGLLSYTENAPFELCIARLIDASPEDYLTLEATSMFYVDQSLYMDYAEMAQAILDGAADLCVFGARMPGEVKDMLTPVYETALAGPFLGVFVQADAANLQATEAAVLAMAEQEDVQAALKAAGYTEHSQLGADEFGQLVKELFQSYIQYLTNEGLFFYEF